MKDSKAHGHFHLQAVLRRLRASQPGRSLVVKAAGERRRANQPLDEQALGGCRAKGSAMVALYVRQRQRVLQRV
jgi:hypothetical protein